MLSKTNFFCFNSQKNELLIGTLNGELLIFKDSSTIPLATTKELGMVAKKLIKKTFDV